MDLECEGPRLTGTAYNTKYVSFRGSDIGKTGNIRTGRAATKAAKRTRSRGVYENFMV